MSEDKSTLTRLEEEGDIAADYLEELLDICDLDGDIDIDVENGRAAVEVVSEEYGDRWLKRLVGENGRVLDALQELTRLAVQTKTGERSRLMLDVAGFRAGVRAELAELAREVIAEVERTGEPARMKAMNPFERKVVHDAVKAAGLVSESEGAEPNRRVVIMPADDHVVTDEVDEDEDEVTDEELGADEVGGDDASDEDAQDRGDDDADDQDDESDGADEDDSDEDDEVSEQDDESDEDTDPENDDEQ